MSESTRITDFLKVTSRLIGVLEREIKMLRAMKPAEIQDLQQDKIVLTAAYEAQVKMLNDEPELLEAMSPNLRGQLKSAIEKFNETLRENERMLRAVKITTERVLTAIADEIEKQRMQNLGYSANGDLTPTSRRSSRQPVSIACDERF